ncbi:MAG: element excision factor XisI family protein [Thiolinea sp.]
MRELERFASFMVEKLLFFMDLQDRRSLSNGYRVGLCRIDQEILLEYAQYKPAYGDSETSVSFDDEHANYVLLQAGWDRDDYLHGAIVHVRLIDGKIWIQYDGTEEGVASG